jgi:hypothetical protein
VVDIKWLVAAASLLLSFSCSSSATKNSASGPVAGSGLTPLVTPAAAGGGASTAQNPFGEGTACSSSGATRRCCGSAGTQTCSGTAEFLAWGACVDARGAAVSCEINQPSGCGMGEFATACDAGVDSGVPHHCGEGEFAPDCEMPKLCTDSEVNTEPEILAAYAPASGASVGASGQIKVWVNDERPALIALNEQIDASGAITMPGDRAAKAPDGYLWEPALYIAPQTAENGGTPHFPQTIRGWYNNMPPYVKGSKTTGVEVMGMDPAPAGTKLPERYTTEFTWDVSALGLKPGSYAGEFVIHDGDRDRAVGCVTIVIASAP